MPFIDARRNEIDPVVAGAGQGELAAPALLEFPEPLLGFVAVDKGGNFDVVFRCGENVVHLGDIVLQHISEVMGVGRILGLDISCIDAGKLDLAAFPCPDVPHQLLAQRPVQNCLVNDPAIMDREGTVLTDIIGPVRQRSQKPF